ncbi:MAG: hypothetical protein JW839_07475 [Candidatus Lokiarchaeota archaeon]|nr:hypothetical protein [Candidatus Lokiarchaeota archaeon]
MVKVKAGVVAGSVPVLAALALILLPFISYIAWAIEHLLINPGMACDPTGPSTVLDFIGVQSGYVILGIVIAFVGFPVFNECVKNLRREAQDHALLLDELRSHDVNGLGMPVDGDGLTNRELVYGINAIHASQGSSPIREKLLCFECGSTISPGQNQRYHAACPDCYYMRRGAIAYARAAGLIGMATLLALAAVMVATAWIWFGVIGLGAIALCTIAWGHYLRESKPRV